MNNRERRQLAVYNVGGKLVFGNGAPLPPWIVYLAWEPAVGNEGDFSAVTRAESNRAAAVLDALDAEVALVFMCVWLRQP